MNSTPSCKEIFLAFQKMAFSSFGGALPWSRIVLVEERGWLSEDEYAEVLSFCQFIPGPNVVNMSVVVGQKFHGPRGALTAFLGLMTFPFFLSLTMGFLYFKYKYVPHLKGTIEGIGSVAAGLIIVTALRMLIHLYKKKPAFLIFSLLAFIPLAFFSVHSLFVLFVLVPIASYFSLRDYKGLRK